jgi:hypothetical protein
MPIYAQLVFVATALASALTFVAIITAQILLLIA